MRADADAKAKAFAGGFSGRDWLVSGALGLLGLLPLIVFGDGILGAPRAEILWVATALAVAGTWVAGVYFKARIGGYTGDPTFMGDFTAEEIAAVYRRQGIRAQPSLVTHRATGVGC